MSEEFPYYGPFPSLSFLQRLVLQVRKCVFVEYRTPEGYSGSVPVYVVKCRRHGYYLDTPHGFNGYFSCRDCLAELHIKEAIQVKIGAQTC